MHSVQKHRVKNGKLYNEELHIICTVLRKYAVTVINREKKKKIDGSLARMMKMRSTYKILVAKL